MPLTLLAGPANAGKVALLLDRYLAALEREPVSDRAEPVGRRARRARPAAAHAGAPRRLDRHLRRPLRAARRATIPAPAASPPTRSACWSRRRAIARAELNGLGRSARFGGFADALLAAVSELESGLLDPAELDGDLARLYAAYREELDAARALGSRSAAPPRRRAARAASSRPGTAQPVFAYGFEDLTGAEWALLEALAGRAR